MKGAIAAGHTLTAEAGARVLAGGGNAFDACIAAAFVSWVAESPLTGPGAGGFLLAHRHSADAHGPRDELLDFFVEVPGRGLRPDDVREMERLEVAFDADTTQVFLIGAAACAVPGTVAGLAEAHRRYGTIPWAELLAPAIEVARSGLEVTETQAFFHTILDGVLRWGPDGRRIYGERAPLGPGDRIVFADLAGTLEQLAADGAASFYRGNLAERICAYVLELGGRITGDDLAAYRVVRRRPVRVPYRGHELVSNPPPSAGGVLIAFVLRVLDRLGPLRPSGSAAAVATVAEAMREASRVRGGSFSRELPRGGLAGRLLADERIDEAAERVGRAAREGIREHTGAPSTTHISVVDADGNAASLSASTGCGSGIVVPGTGIHLNNMLGETDLNPDDGRVRPGRRLSSMMAPSVLVAGGRPRLVLGSAGSIRLRAAILQIVLNVVDHGFTVADAIAAPRIHLDGDVLHLEGGVDPGVADTLEERGYDVVRWGEPNLYFGGAAAVGLGGDGTFEAAGDPRRGGAGVVVR